MFFQIVKGLLLETTITPIILSIIVFISWIPSTASLLFALVDVGGVLIGVALGFLAERWPCGLVIEVGPVPQNVRRSDIVLQTRLALEAVLAAITSVRDGSARYPDQVVIHLHLGSLDVPRRSSGDSDALVHPNLQGRDWQPLKAGDPLFIDAESNTVVFDGEDGLVPVFINEAAYAEKAIALSLTKRETWPLPKDWKEALAELLR